MNYKPNLFLTSNVFLEISKNEKISPEIRNQIKELWEKLNDISNLKIFGIIHHWTTSAELIEF